MLSKVVEKIVSCLLALRRCRLILFSHHCLCDLVCFPGARRKILWCLRKKISIGLVIGWSYIHHLFLWDLIREKEARQGCCRPCLHFVGAYCVFYGEHQHGLQPRLISKILTQRTTTEIIMCPVKVNLLEEVIMRKLRKGRGRKGGSGFYGDFFFHGLPSL